jgi:hypothetical protein
MWTKEDSDATPAKLNRIEENGVARARVLQAEIEGERRALITCPPSRNGSIVARLQSLDAEMARVCALPGVMNALYGDAPTDPA